eukprot:COSAG05_NODE_5818_length_1080_cov_2.815946_1_plen_32_part_10
MFAIIPECEGDGRLPHLAVQQTPETVLGAYQH